MGFSVGDKLRLVEGVNLNCGTMNGLIRNGHKIDHYVIDSIHNNGSVDTYRAVDIDGKRLKACYGCIKDNQFEKLNQENISMNNSYKPGDTLDLKDVKTLVQFNDQPRRNVNNGTLFVVVDREKAGTGAVSTGQVLKLDHNDGSSCPSFQTNIEGNTTYVSWAGLAEIPQAAPGKPVVNDVITRYSDGVTVSAETLAFDGKTFKREELTELVKKYTEILKRPVAEVAVAAASKTAAEKREAENARRRAKRAADKK